jgi:hypothetical protein
MAGVECQTKMRAGAVAAVVGIALAAAMYGDAHAAIMQQASVIHSGDTGSGNLTTDDFDAITSPPDTLRGVSAEIVGPGFRGTASVGPFGNLGIDALMAGPGTLSSQIIISNNEFTNPLPIPQRAAAQFIIDGGRLAMLAGVGSRLILVLQLTADVDDRDGVFVGEESFAANIELEQLPTGLEYRTAGEDLGATFDGAFSVAIPLSLQSLDLGTIPGGGNVSLSYRLQIFADIDGFSEIVAYQFSDPLQLDGTGEFPVVLFSAATVVPEPSGLVALAIGAVGLVGAGRWRPAATPLPARTQQKAG